MENRHSRKNDPMDLGGNLGPTVFLDQRVVVG